MPILAQLLLLVNEPRFVIITFVRDKIKDLIATIASFDSLEEQQIADALQWISSGVEIYRIKKPDIPSKHLVSYFVLIDKEKKKLLLINHIKAGLWLPPGGHVIKNEYPRDTVKREIVEELRTNAQFISNSPFFITVTKTVNIDVGHTDVSLWYLLHGDSSEQFDYEMREMKGYKWFSIDEILNSKRNIFDPHMKRFTNKLLLFIL